MLETRYNDMPLPQDLKDLLSSCRSFLVPRDRSAILQLAMGDGKQPVFEVAYDIPGRGRIVEATVTQCKNGLCVNYIDPRMRRRDPDCMVIGDEQPSDKERFEERFGSPFAAIRQQTLAWLQQNDLIVLPLYTGGKKLGFPPLLLARGNEGFFFEALADLQEMLDGRGGPLAFRPQ